MMKRIKYFLRESRLEVKKVTWPTVQMLKRTTVMVLILLVIIGFFIGFIDVIFSRFVAAIVR
ncbi:MAG: preprotein translocase subunit SecE [Candidatus Ratteibacteria bacterium]|jgi:preprotein translocase subunit SecE